MFEYSNQKRDPVSIIFYCGLVPFGVFWVVSRSLTAGFALQAYAVTVTVFVVYPFEMKARNLRQWWFWKRLLHVGLPIDLLVLMALWYLDATYRIFVTGTGTVMFVGFVVGVVVMVVVGEIVDRVQPQDSDPGPESST